MQFHFKVNLKIYFANKAFSSSRLNFVSENAIAMAKGVILVICIMIDIGLDSSVVKHLISDARVLGLITGPAIYFHL